MPEKCGILDVLRTVPVLRDAL